MYFFFLKNKGYLEITFRGKAELLSFSGDRGTDPHMATFLLFLWSLTGLEMKNFIEIVEKHS